MSRPIKRTRVANAVARSRRLGAGLLAAALASHAGCVLAARADFGHERASPDVQHVGNWVVHSRDNAGQAFAIVDKVGSRVYVFDARGRLLGAAPALVGLAPGDDSVPGIGERGIASIQPQERTTPAGRFVASLGRGAQGDDLLWVDYEDAIALHRVVSNVPEERRLQRLASPSAADRRITYGCINVPVRFYDEVVLRAFGNGGGIVYVLPETRSAREVFGSYDVR